MYSIQSLLIEDSLPGLEGTPGAGGAKSGEPGTPAAPHGAVGSLPTNLAAALYPANGPVLQGAYRKIETTEGLPKLTQAELVAVASAAARILKALPMPALTQLLKRLGIV